MARWEPNARWRLVEAAVDLFEEQGYDRTGVAQIAERAGLTKTTFFRHFHDKREVLFAGGEIHRQLLTEAIAAEAHDATPLEAVAAALDALACSFPADHRAFAVRLRIIVEANDDLRERQELKLAGYLEAIRTALQSRGTDGTAAAVAAELGVLAFRLAFSRWIESPGPVRLPELTRDALDQVRAASLALT